MALEFSEGKIISKVPFYKDVLYDVSNNLISVQFNGKGCVSKYSIINGRSFSENVAAFKIFINNKEMFFKTPKKVEMIGRLQYITYETDYGEIKIVMFLHREHNCVFEKIVFDLKKAYSVKAAMYIRGAVPESFGRQGNTYTASYRSGLTFSCDYEFTNISENSTILFENENAAPGFTVNMTYGYGNDSIPLLNEKFDLYERETENEIKSVFVPDSVVTEKEKAQYFNTMFCALENYKEIGDFKAFMAGWNYISPARTYFRDSYFTVLAMYNGYENLVKNQILTLARGIAPDGTCPSAVICDFSAWWNSHYDSPSFFCIMLYDYVNNTKDTQFLDERINNLSLLEIAQRVMGKLAENCDDTGLIVKSGEYNKRDWADEVNRFGYVTYDEILYARALFCLSKLLKLKGDDSHEKYFQEYQRVKDSINELLWDDNLGHYVNYTDGSFTESNLSIDTVLAVIFKIADEQRAKTLLNSCVNKLESRNNDETDDYGVKCVYPLYSRIDAGIIKSFQPYNYHNGADWPYLSAMYAYALKMYSMDYKYPLERWFDYNVKRGNFTPIEYYSPYCPDGSLLQAWSSASAFVFNDTDCKFFENKI